MAAEAGFLETIPHWDLACRFLRARLGSEGSCKDTYSHANIITTLELHFKSRQTQLVVVYRQQMAVWLHYAYSTSLLSLGSNVQSTCLRRVEDKHFLLSRCGSSNFFAYLALKLNAEV